jgi:dynein assembly factor with WDR repeat domains 1
VLIDGVLFGINIIKILKMKLKKILIRYFPPGITLEYVRSNGEIESKCIDLLNLSKDTNIDELITEIMAE